MASESTKTEVGNVFISNYPPYSQWKPELVDEVYQAMASPGSDVPLGLYLHIPFCRKRCKFCYYRVYTEKNAQEVESYVQALSKELELLSQQPVLGGRQVRFVYFGGGTPSFLSPKQLGRLFDRLQQHLCWDGAEEVTFECEPGTLSQTKVETLRSLGVTRLSLGVENFNDRILEENGRAHLSAEIYRAWEWIQQADFPNVNIDLIAGMVGESWDNWRDCIRRTLELAPDSVTIYQMELPYNTIYSRDLLGNQVEIPVPDWPTKRAWVSYAIDRLQQAGYTINSAYTLVKDAERVHFKYRDHLWHGADLLAAGVASFGHVAGVHYQNLPDWETYLPPLLERNELPLWRAYRPSRHQLLVREMILQLKLGHIRPSYFEQKFGVNVLEHWAPVWQQYQEQGYLVLEQDRVQLTRDGLLRVDGLLPAFFEPQFQGIRYT